MPVGSTGSIHIHTSFLPLCSWTPLCQSAFGLHRRLSLQEEIGQQILAHVPAVTVWKKKHQNCHYIAGVSFPLTPHWQGGACVTESAVLHCCTALEMQCPVLEVNYVLVFLFYRVLAVQLLGRECTRSCESEITLLCFKSSEYQFIFSLPVIGLVFSMWL